MVARYAPEEQNEAIAAFESCRGTKKSISKSAIYTEIEQHPDRYPCLSSRSPQRILTVISYIMNSRFARFGGETTGRQMRNAVWVIA